MVSKKRITDIFNKLVQEDTEDKCRGYLSPSQRVKKFNPNDFVQETYAENQDWNNTKKESYFISPVGTLQQIQQDLQDKTDYPTEDKNFMNNFHWDSYWFYINQFLNKDMNEKTREFIFDENGDFRKHDVFMKGELTLGPDDYSEDKKFMGYHNSYTVPMDINDMIGRTSKVIDESPRLQQNTLLHRFGTWTPGLKAGDWGDLKGFLSTSYNPYVAEESIKHSGLNWIDSDRYMMNIYALKGVKGLVMDSNNFDSGNRYSEWLLDNGQRYVVLSQDDINKTVDILVY